ncbi:MAG: hypothetical protein KGL39_35640 [Patescibacteria group bacterium]|nr:hypothetical protein [Patescibacteria group bacterium]
MANSVNYTSYSHSPGGSDFAFRFVANFTGSYVNGTGETINLFAAGNPNGLELNGFLPPTTLVEVIVDILAASLGGYGVGVSAYNAGSFVVTFYSAAGTELASGAYPAGITGGQITFQVRHKG